MKVDYPAKQLFPCCYNVDDRPQANWRWPKDTWFLERLGHQLKVSRDYRLLA